MQTFTIKINERSKAGIAFQKMLEILETQPGVEVVNEDRSPYNPEFVEKITAARKEKGGKIVTSENLWQNIK